MNRIKVLSENLCNKIAAGEVVERPASVVKELVENALDAGADEILIDVESGGKKLIRVQDNGSGMSRDDLFLSLERHATSKIANDDDLFRLTTLGFRGEALPSIAAVSRLQLQSRTVDAEVGWQIKVNGGAVADAEAVGVPTGTMIEVRNLFFNTPARRKFLRSDQTEIGHVGDVVSRQALARPEVRFRLTHNGRVLIDARKAEQLEPRVAAILGREAVREMFPVLSESGDLALHGLLSRPLYNRSATSSIYTYINGRFIRDRVVQHAVMDGYRSLLMKGRYPVVVLFVDLPTDQVDVNVHPTKHEVRFREQGLVHGFISAAVRNALRPAAAINPGSVNILDTDEDSLRPPSVETAVHTQKSGPTGTVARPTAVREPLPAYRPLDLPLASSPSPATAPPPVFTLPEAGAATGAAASMTLIGQFRESYILCQDGDDLVLVDQHAAHERVAFERLKVQLFGSGIEKQALLFPVVLEFDFREASQLQNRLEQLDGLGFDLEAFGGNAYVLKSIPQLLGNAEAEGLVRDVASDLADLGESTQLEDAYDHLLATMACHSVVRARQRMSPEQMRALLREIDTVDFSGHCPHGRPVMQRVTLGEIERMFKRT